jgi:LPXTG-motif cell wall-anchored protein
VVLAVALLSSLGGMGLAVVAFGQDAGNPDASVPTGDYTATTPATAPLSGYTTTAPTSGYTTTTPTTVTTSRPSAGGSTPSKGSTRGRTPSHAQASVPARRSQPSRATRSGPTHLAFTGAEPIALGAAGFALMLAGLALHLRRRRATPGGPLA